MIKRAVISVSDKNGLADFAKGLVEAGVEIISTGGTAKFLEAEGIKVIPVQEVTGFPECLDGRVKTLHPKIHGGILAQRHNQEHMEKLEELNIATIDLLVINLYPFKETVMKTGVTQAECIENIDIGGPSMLRAAAKNYQDVTVVVDPNDYHPILKAIQENQDTELEQRFQLAQKVFEHTAAYDALIAEYFQQLNPDEAFRDKLSLTFEKVDVMRYGENPHQKAAFYQNAIPLIDSLAAAEQIQGKQLSYNNIADTDAAIAVLKEFTEPTVCAIKHANPCGIASADNILTAWEKAYEADPISIFGGIVALNRPVTLAVAEKMKPVFLEVLVAPAYDAAALDFFAENKKNLRVLCLPEIAKPYDSKSMTFKAVHGGLLVQSVDTGVMDILTSEVPTTLKPDASMIEDFLFAMRVVKHVKSNAIVLVKDQQTIGIGPGQPNRITSAAIAIKQAGDKAKGAILGSDAFFPFSDTVELAATAGIKGIVQPGGSIRDEESIEACNKAGIPMMFTHQRHFKH